MKRIDELVGSEINHWHLEEIIGSGADGVVYRATKGNQLAAVKIFRPESFMKSGLDEGRNRLEPQLALIGKKHHPNLVEVFEGGDFFELQTLYLVMEYVAGISLDKLIGKIPTNAIEKLVSQLSSVAKHLEDNELVHRDIKPANIVVSEDFQSLTLLDLSIIHNLLNDEDDARLSGRDFVATLRYSPPEFVWREEQGDTNEGWRAVTFYQMGATIHDIVMGKQLFAGMDSPRARLYDCVRNKIPEVRSDEVDAWLIEVIKACLLKDWRQRLQCVDWKSFNRPETLDPLHLERRIRILQANRTEALLDMPKNCSKKPTQNREIQLWQLNDALFSEVRTYLLETNIFPRFLVNQSNLNQTEYKKEITFEIDKTLGFDSVVCFEIWLAIDSDIPEATRLTFNSKKDDKTLVGASWTEMFSVNKAFALCQRAMLHSVQLVLDSK